MRILLTTTSGIGHLHPLVPLARAAMAGGHDVRVAAPGSLAPVLDERGLVHEALPDYSPEHLAHVEQVMRGLGPPGAGAELPMFREVFGWAKTDSTLHAMRRAVERWQPDLLLHEAAELSGAMAAEEAGVPHATVAMSLRHVISTFLPHAAEGAATLAASIGLPPDVEARRILDAPYATMVPPSMEAPDAAMPEVVVRYRLTDIHTASPSPTLEATGPLVWIALGTETWQIPGLMERVAPVVRAATEALSDVSFLLTTGSRDAARPAMPANVQVEAYVPQEAVLQRCQLVLGHGGFNTTMAALRQGVPLVVMPLFATDQFENAGRLAAIGAAVAVEAPDADVLGKALDRGLTDPSLRTAAGRLADEMAGLPTPAEALDRLTRQV